MCFPWPRVLKITISSCWAASFSSPQISQNPVPTFETFKIAFPTQDVGFLASEFSKVLIQRRMFLLSLVWGKYQLSDRLSCASIPQKTSHIWSGPREDCFLDFECSKSRMNTTWFLLSAPECISAPGEVLSWLKYLDSVQKFTNRWTDVWCLFSGLVCLKYTHPFGCAFFSAPA